MVLGTTSIAHASGQIDPTFFSPRPSIPSRADQHYGGALVVLLPGAGT